MGGGGEGFGGLGSWLVGVGECMGSGFGVRFWRVWMGGEDWESGVMCGWVRFGGWGSGGGSEGGGMRIGKEWRCGG